MLVPTQLRQLIGFATIVWGVAIFAGQGLLWLNALVNASLGNAFFVIFIAFLASLSGIWGGWLLIRQKEVGFWLTTPFCFYHAATSYLRYSHYAEETSGAATQLALLSAILGAVLLVCTFFSKVFGARSVVN